MSSVRHLIFDFFGTLVTYPSSFMGLHEHHDSWQLLCRAGLKLSYNGFLDSFMATREQLEAHSQASLEEYSIAQLVACFFDQHMPAGTAASLQQRFAETYLTEWSQSVHHPLEVATMLHRLHGHYSLSILSNCHHRPLVEQHLRKLGAEDLMVDILTSAETGLRKPHPELFSLALERLEMDAEECLFIGDSYLPDYVGPTEAGITSWLIDPGTRYAIPAEHRLKCVMGVETRLLRQRMACA